MNRVAKCACGSASLTVSGEPVAHSVCHCNNCKKRTGSAFGISAYFPKLAIVAMQGTTTLYPLHNVVRGDDQERHFCSRCGTTLYWYLSTLPELIGIAGGCFADDPLGEPDITASHSEKWEWVTVPSTWRVWPE